MASVAQIHSPHTVPKCHRVHPVHARHTSSLRLFNFSDKKQPCESSINIMFSPLKAKPVRPNLVDGFRPLLCSGGGSGGGSGVGHGSGGGGGNSGSGSGSGGSDSLGLIGFLLSGWRARVAADPQFPFKVLMEEVVGVGSAVLGDMATRPNFGLNELDFVFSTLVVGSILNFTLMYLLAPTMASSSAAGLPFIFANCPTGHMFEPGSYSLVNRLGTLVYKGTVFAAVGLAAGLVGTALSNGLIKMRKKMDPNFESPNKPPPTLLNAMTWAIHMGVSSNVRYQALNGIEYLLAKGLPPVLFKSSVIGLRMANNVLGGMTFVMLARITGSQSSGAEKKTEKVDSHLE
ncbi:hypothetical protein Hanom_Chr06g00527861 [Helianthus anomalus]